MIIIFKNSGYTEIVKLLLKAGALKGVKNILGDTALDVATSKGEIQLYQQLMRCELKLIQFLIQALII